MTVQEIIKARGIREVLHFTTYQGLVGILDSGTIKSRARLSEDQRLRFILRLNTPKVRDPGWEDWINLSISAINTRLFDFSSISWHPKVWWCVLSFSPTVLADADVVFATTNNCYPSVKRRSGPEGLEALFATRVVSRYEHVKERSPTLSDAYPTCEEAEVLYPGELGTDRLQRIYVAKDEDQDDVHGYLSAVGHPQVDVAVAPDVFRGRGD